MAWKPTGPPPSGRSAIDRREERGEQEERGERFGAIAIARDVKDDGRALILYTRARPEPA